MIIESLTPAQIAKLPEYVSRFTAQGLSTEPIDRGKATEAVHLLYKCGGLVPPKEIIFCESPLGCVLAINTLKQVNSVGASVRASVGASVWASVWDSVRASVGDSVRASVGGFVGDSFWASVGGQYLSPYASFYSFMREELQLVEETEKALGLFAVIQETGWVFPYADLCFVSNRPEQINGDDAGRLHSLTGPAFRYLDGFQAFAVHGVRVTEQVVMSPETITVKQIQEEKNIEIQRVMLELLGEAKYLEEIGAKPIHEDRYGRLYRAEFQNDEALCLVRVINSTPEPDGSSRIYWLRCHPELRPLLGDTEFGEPQEFTAKNAVASLAGMTGAKYAPEIET